ncbi:hypothetical protein [Sphingobacterium sp. IITKGP-BTPF85]|uniref:hypothetical protein n=1 Tax=Sphingobacterium sp. IITKGP-BTPF85 TaxID=1338009 RepID=UPI00038A1309|nr:hypothetical protein [Sphingobacterium sp. IITKGP-BTPF85]KKX49755.1 hypothetical protein L950_0214125 [Sphingobacterium sp. IITKGP-BTPF85]
MKSLLSVALLLGITSSLSAQNKISLLIHNTSSFERKEVVSIPYEKFKQHFELKDTVSILEEESKKPVIYQLEKRGKSTPQNVLIAVHIAPKAKLNLLLPPLHLLRQQAKHMRAMSLNEKMILHGKTML